MDRSGRRIYRGILLGAVCLMVLSGTMWAEGGGANLFKAKCAACHGADGSGNTPMGKSMKLRDLGSPEVQKESDAEFTAITANGKGAMPAYKDKLTSDQIKQLVVFMRSLAKK